MYSSHGDKRLFFFSFIASLRQYSLNNKGSKVAKRTPSKMKKSSEPIPQVAGKENDSTPDLKESKQKDGSVERPKKRRRVHFKSSNIFERKKPTLVLTSIQTE